MRRAIAHHEVVGRAAQPGHPTWVLLHGFTGAPASWDAVAKALPTAWGVAAIALAGHGGSPDADPAAPFEAAVEALCAVLDALGPDPVSVAGYSLGGRLTLGLAARCPDRLARALVIGAHPGLEHDEERRARARQDEVWARCLETEGLQGFLPKWAALELFATQANLPAARRAARDDIRRAHDPDRLAACLRQLSLSRMPRWQFDDAAPPLRVVIGALDPKFRALSESLARNYPRADREIVPGCGHNVLLEAPQKIAELLQSMVG